MCTKKINDWPLKLTFSFCQFYDRLVLDLFNRTKEGRTEWPVLVLRRESDIFMHYPSQNSSNYTTAFDEVFGCIHINTSF